MKRRIWALSFLLLACVALAMDRVYPDLAAVIAALRFTTTATLSLYVNSSSGSDSNDCQSSGAACATIAGACAKVPPIVYHAVTITSATGSTYSAGGCKIQPQLLTTGSTPASITFTVPLITATGLSTGTATGTATSTSTGTGKTFSVLTDSGNNWPALAGQYFLAVGGTAYAIAANTATTITIADSANLGATPAYTIQSAGASITGNTSGTYTDNSGTARSAAFWISAGDGPAGNTEITISGFSFASGVTRAAAIWDGRANFTNVLFPGNSSDAVNIYGSGSVRIRNSAMTASGKVLVSGDPGSTPRVVSVRNSVVIAGQIVNTQGPTGYHDFAWNYTDASGTSGIAYALCGSTATQLIFDQCKAGAACIDNRGCNASQPAAASVALEAVTFTAGANTSIGLVGVAGTGATVQVDKLGIFGFSTLDASPNANAQVAVVDQGGELALSTSTTVTPSASGGVFCLGLHGAKCWTASQLSGFGGVINGPDGSVIQYYTGTTITAAALTPIATGSLPTCQAAPTGGSSTQGLIAHDSTKGRFVGCDGSLTHQVIATHRYVVAYLNPGALLLGTAAEQEVTTGTTTVCTGTPSAPCICGTSSGSPCPSNSSGATTGTTTFDTCQAGTGVALGSSASTTALEVSCRVANAGKMMFHFDALAGLTAPTSLYACSCTPGF